MSETSDQAKRATALLRDADRLIATKKFAEARRILQQALAHDPKNPHALKKLDRLRKARGVRIVIRCIVALVVVVGGYLGFVFAMNKINFSDGDGLLLEGKFQAAIDKFSKCGTLGVDEALLARKKEHVRALLDAEQAIAAKDWNHGAAALSRATVADGGHRQTQRIKDEWSDKRDVWVAERLDEARAFNKALDYAKSRQAIASVFAVYPEHPGAKELERKTQLEDWCTQGQVALKQKELATAYRLALQILEQDKGHLGALQIKIEARIASLHQVKSVAAHQGNVRSLSFGKNGGWLASVGEDNKLKVWDARTLASIKEFDAHSGKDAAKSVAFSPDGKLLASVGFGEVKVFDTQKWSVPRRLEGTSMSTMGVLCVAFSPDGSLLASGSHRELRIWNVAQLESAPRTIAAHAAAIRVLAFSPDSRRLATGSDDRTVKIWNVDDGSEIKALPLDGWVNAIAYSPDGKVLLAGTETGTIKAFATDSWAEVKTAIQSDQVTSLAFFSNGKYFVSGGFTGAARVWDFEAFKPVKSIQPSRQPVNAVAVAPDCNTVMVAGVDTITVWRPAD